MLSSYIATDVCKYWKLSILAVLLILTVPISFSTSSATGLGKNSISLDSNIFMGSLLDQNAYFGTNTNQNISSEEPQPIIAELDLNTMPGFSAGRNQSVGKNGPELDQKEDMKSDLSDTPLLTYKQLENLERGGRKENIFKTHGKKSLKALNALFSEINLLCDNSNISLVNEFKETVGSSKVTNLGSSRVKQKITLTNNSSEAQTATIAIEFSTHFSRFKKTEGEFSSKENLSWKAKKTKTSFTIPDGNSTTVETEFIADHYLQFSETEGYFDWADMFETGTNPTVFITREGSLTKIHLALEISFEAYETRVIDPIYDLNSANAGMNKFTVRFDGASASDILGFNNTSGLGVQLVNVDNNAYANDLLITAISADTQGLTNNGAVYLILNIDSLTGNKWLGDGNFSARFDGASTNDLLGYVYGSGLGVQLVNIDNNSSSNDLLMTAAWADTQGLSDNGAVYLIKDINTISGNKWLRDDVNFSARWDGGATNDYFGRTGSSGLGVQLVNIDNNSSSNDLLMTAAWADTQGLSDNGAVYLIKDINTISGNKWLKEDVNFSARWDGASASDQLGYTNNSGLGVQLVDTDGNDSSNDLLITVPYADTLGKTNNGVVYFIKDINTISGNKWLKGDVNFGMRWDGGASNDYLGRTSSSSLGVQLVNTDNNSSSNDLLIAAYLADTQGLSDNGAVYLIKDINTLSGSKWLKGDVNFSARWDGGSALDYLAYTVSSGLGVQLVNLDGNDSSNDLLITGVNSDTQGLVNNGAVYLIKDINTISGNKWLKGDVNFSARWDGGTSNDRLGFSNNAGLGVQLVNLDGNAYSNDLLITDVNASTQGLTNNGAVYLIKDINTIIGDKWLIDDVNFSARWDGGSALDYLAYTCSSGLGVQLVNLDGNAYSNDLLITDVNASTQGLTNNGAVYLLKDIDQIIGNKWLKDDVNFSARWDGASASDQLGYTNNSGLGVQLVNLDNNSSSNDLLITGVNSDTQGLVNNGAVYLLKDIDQIIGNKWLKDDVNFSARWDGASASDQLGYTNNSGLGVQLVNLDNNSSSNDLLMAAVYADTQGLTDNGTLYFIKSLDPLGLGPTTTTDANNSWQNTDSNIHLTCVDDSGCSSTKYRLDVDSTGLVSYGSWQAYDTNILITSDGNYAFDFNSTDTLGNAESTNTIYILIDKTAPVSTSDANSTWQKTDANIHLACSDINSGCAITKYRLDTDASSAVSYSAWQIYDTNILITSDGNYALDFNSTDNASNTETTDTNYVLIDKSVPALSTNPSSSASASGTSYLITYSATDSYSGIKQYFISDDNVTFAATSATNYALVGSSGSSKTFYIYAQDYADNNSPTSAVTISFESSSSGGEFCGNRVCTHSETCANCPYDCGVCSGSSGSVVLGQPVSVSIGQVIAQFSIVLVPSENSIRTIETTSDNMQEKRTAKEGELLYTRSLISTVVLRSDSNYFHELSLSVDNISGHTITGLTVYENLPAFLAGRDGNIYSELNFRLADNNSLIIFSVPALTNNSFYTFKYSFYSKELLAKQAFDSLQAPVALLKLTSDDLCLGVICSNSNPCTDNFCEQGGCLSRNKADGAYCGPLKICKAGSCIDKPLEEGQLPSATVPQQEPPKEETNPLVILAAATVLVAMAIGTFMFLRKQS